MTKLSLRKLTEENERPVNGFTVRETRDGLRDQRVGRSDAGANRPQQERRKVRVIGGLRFALRAGPVAARGGRSKARARPARDRRREGFGRRLRLRAGIAIGRPWQRRGSRSSRVSARRARLAFAPAGSRGSPRDPSRASCLALTSRLEPSRLRARLARLFGVVGRIRLTSQSRLRRAEWSVRSASRSRRSIWCRAG